VLSHLSSSLTGLITIRAHQSQEICQRAFDDAQDVNTSARFIFIATSRWFAVWMDLIGAIYIACVTFTCVSLPANGNFQYLII
jgi:ATP-binding cassette subfamily C (CFTR/MRP) protein 4